MLKDPAVQAHAPTRVPVDDEFAGFCLTHREIENHRLARLMHVTRPDPILVVEWGDGTHVIVDGNHRYVAASMRGHKLTQINTNWPEQVPSLAMDVQEQQFTRDYAMALIPVAWMMPIVPEDQKDTAVHIFVETIRQVCHQRIMF